MRYLFSLGCGLLLIGLGFLFSAAPQAQSVYQSLGLYATSARGQLPGTATNDAATAGNIGEYVSASTALDSLSLTTNTAANLASISLTAGDWNIGCKGYFTVSGTTSVLYTALSVGPTSATFNGTAGFFDTGVFGSGSVVLVNTQRTTRGVSGPRVSLSATTTYFCHVLASFTVSTLTAGGLMYAIRVR